MVAIAVLPFYDSPLAHYKGPIPIANSDSLILASTVAKA
jgi:hypothetical protein